MILKLIYLANFLFTVTVFVINNFRCTFLNWMNFTFMKVERVMANVVRLRNSIFVCRWKFSSTLNFCLFSSKFSIYSFSIEWNHCDRGVKLGGVSVYFSFIFSVVFIALHVHLLHVYFICDDDDDDGYDSVFNVLPMIEFLLSFCCYFYFMKVVVIFYAFNIRFYSFEKCYNLFMNISQIC